MVTHRYHPDPEKDPEVAWDALILYDDCERCTEHAVRPRASLDHQHLARLIEVARGEIEPVTDTEKQAAATLAAQREERS